MLPSEYPKWGTVHAHFAKWGEPGPDGFSVLERALKTMWLARLVQKGRKYRRTPLPTSAMSLSALFNLLPQSQLLAVQHITSQAL